MRSSVLTNSVSSIHIDDLVTWQARFGSIFRRYLQGYSVFIQFSRLKGRFIKDFNISHQTQVLLLRRQFLAVTALLQAKNNAFDGDLTQPTVLSASYLVERSCLFSCVCNGRKLICNPPAVYGSTHITVIWSITKTSYLMPMIFSLPTYILITQ